MHPSVCRSMAPAGATNIMARLRRVCLASAVPPPPATAKHSDLGVAISIAAARSQNQHGIESRLLPVGNPQGAKFSGGWYKALDRGNWFRRLSQNSLPRDPQRFAHNQHVMRVGVEQIGFVLHNADMAAPKDEIA